MINVSESELFDMRVGRHGNQKASTVITIPRTFVKKLQLTPGSYLRVRLEGGEIIMGATK